MQPNVLCAGIKDILFLFLIFEFLYIFCNMFDNKEKKSSIFLIEYT